MALNSYFDYYKSRIMHDGYDEQERISTRLARDFEHLLKTSPDSVDITYDGGMYDAVLNSGNSRVGAQTERKVIQYLLTRLDLELPEGAVFDMEQRITGEQTTWIVLHREIHSYYGYYKYKIVELDYKVNYVDEYGVLHTVPAYINGTGEFDIKEYFRYSLNTISEVPNRALNFIWAANPDIKQGVRIMIGDEVWKVVDSDKISIPGVYYSTLYKTVRDEYDDDVPTQVASNNLVGSVGIVSPYGDTNALSVPLGAPLIFYNERNGQEIDDGSFQFSTSDSSVIAIEGTNVVTKGVGSATLTVRDKVTAISERFAVTVFEPEDHYCYVRGDKVIGIGEATILTLISDVAVEASTSSNLIKLKQNGLTLRVLASDSQIGTATIDFVYDNEIISSYVLEIKSIWVS